MSEKLDNLLRDTNDYLSRISGVRGCDLVTGVTEFVAKNGLIYAAISNADASKIASYRLPNTTTQITTDTWIAADINNDKIVFFKEPIIGITLSAGSFWVYYK